MQPSAVHPDPLSPDTSAQLPISDLLLRRVSLLSPFYTLPALQVYPAPAQWILRRTGPPASRGWRCSMRMPYEPSTFSRPSAPLPPTSLRTTSKTRPHSFHVDMKASNWVACTTHLSRSDDDAAAALPTSARQHLLGGQYLHVVESVTHSVDTNSPPITPTPTPS